MPSRRKPAWATTNVDWKLKKVIWRSWALGETISQTVAELEQRGEHLDRGTISKVRKELRRLPDEVVHGLLRELPEAKSLVEGQRPGLKVTIAEPPPEPPPVPPELTVDARRKHTEMLTTLIREWESDLEALPIKILDFIRAVAEGKGLDSRCHILLCPEDALDTDPSQAGLTGSFTYSPSNHSFEVRVVLWLEPQSLFDCLTAHLSTSSYLPIWVAWEGLNSRLEKAISHYVQLIREGRLIESYGREDVAWFDVEFSFKGIVSDLLRQLQIARMRGVFPGRCDLCPEAALED